MSEVEYHGWTAHGRTIHVGPVPGRKSIALHSIDGTTVDVLAYFRDEDAARRFLVSMDALLGVGPEGRVLRRLPVSVEGDAA